MPKTKNPSTPSSPLTTDEVKQLTLDSQLMSSSVGLPTVKALLAHGAHPDGPERDGAPLARFMDSGTLANYKVQALIEAGAKVFTNEFLTRAGFHASIETLELLKKSGAPLWDSFENDNAGHVGALLAAASSDRPKVFQWFLKEAPEGTLFTKSITNAIFESCVNQTTSTALTERTAKTQLKMLQLSQEWGIGFDTARPQYLQHACALLPLVYTHVQATDQANIIFQNFYKSTLLPEAVRAQNMPYIEGYVAHYQAQRRPILISESLTDSLYMALVYQADIKNARTFHSIGLLIPLPSHTKEAVRLVEQTLRNLELLNTGHKGQLMIKTSSPSKQLDVLALGEEFLHLVLFPETPVVIAAGQTKDTFLNCVELSDPKISLQYRVKDLVALFALARHGLHGALLGKIQAHSFDSTTLNMIHKHTKKILKKMGPSTTNRAPGQEAFYQSITSIYEYFELQKSLVRTPSISIPSISRI